MAFSIALIAGASHTHWQWGTATRPDVHTMLPLSVPLPFDYGLRTITQDHAEHMSSALLDLRLAGGFLRQRFRMCQTT